MEVLQNRVDSFSKPRRVKHSSSSKSSSTISLKWPHTPRFKATPDTLAEAGFYFNPSYDDRDNVTCYMCDKELSDWAEDDDPFDIHWMKCRNECCWANVRCGLRGDIDRNGRYVFPDKTRVPSSKVMEKARLETFTAGDGWPHDHSRNHGASSKKMAHAGFVYSPQQPGDDLATCLYCNISLNGWDVDDDPMEEHRQRENKSGIPCPFFNNPSPSTNPASSKPVSKAQTTKPSSKSTNKSKRPPKHTDILEPTKIHDGEDSDTTVITAAAKTTGAKTPRKPRATSAAKTPRTLTRSSSRARLREVDDDQGEERNVTPPPRMSRKSSRSQSRSRVDVVEEEENIGLEEDMLPPTVPRKASKTNTKAKTKVGDEKHATKGEEDVSRKASRSRPKSMARSASRSKSKAEIAETEEDEKATPPPTSRKVSKPRSKAEIVKVDLRVERQDGEQGEVLPPPPVSRKPASRSTASISRKVSKANLKAKETEDVDDEDVPVPPSAPVSVSRKPASKVKVLSRKSSKPKAKSKIVEEQNSEEEDEEEDIPAPPPVSKKPPSKSRSKSKLRVVDETDDADDGELLPVPRKSSKSDSKAKSKTNVAAVALAEDDEDEDVPLPPPKPASKSAAARALAKSRSKSKGVDVGDVQSEGGSASGKGADIDANARSGTGTGVEVVEISTDDEEKEEGESSFGKVDKKAPMYMKGGGNKLSQTEMKFRKRGNGGPSYTGSEVEPEPTSKPNPNPRKQGKKNLLVETVQPLRPQPQSQVEDDVEMAEVEEEIVRQEQEQRGSPVTPPRAAVPKSFQQKTITSSSGVTPSLPISPNNNTPTFQFVPPLSKLPFVNLESLSEAEMDMTVEDWIRYQMGMEYEQFKRDGERELASFRGRAEEVRRAIEAL